jgi:hypothetical protein
MTHIENIPHILQHGITHSASINANPTFKPLGDRSLIETRNNFLLNNGKRLGEYIPFYFGVRTPMLYVVQHGFNMVTPVPAENIVYCVSSVQKIKEHRLDFIFTMVTQLTAYLRNTQLTILTISLISSTGNR